MLHFEISVQVGHGADKMKIYIFFDTWAMWPFFYWALILETPFFSTRTIVCEKACDKGVEAVLASILHQDSRSQC